MRHDGVPLEAAEDLLRLALDLAFLATDERHDVADGVQRGDARVAGAGERLERGEGDALQAVLAERRQSQRQDDRRAVGVGDERAGPAALGALQLDESEMLAVDLGNQQRHVGRHAMVPRVADDDVAGLREGLLDLAGDGGIHRREEQLGRTACAGPRLLDDEIADLVGQRERQPPGRRGPVGLPRRALAGAHPHEAEPGVPGELGDELLAHHPRGAKHSDVDPLHDLLLLLGYGAEAACTYVRLRTSAPWH